MRRDDRARRARPALPARRRRDRGRRPVPSSSIRARMATAARIAPTSSCPARPTPRSPAPIVNTEGRVQMTERATFAPGDAREDWAILRALSAALGQTLPFDTLAGLRKALYAAHPHFAALDAVAAGRCLGPCRARRSRRQDRQGELRLADRLTSIRPTRSRGPPRSWPNARRWPRAGSGRRRSKAMNWDIVLSLLIMLGKSFAAHRLPARLHRLYPARRPQDLGGGAVAARAQRRRSLRPVPDLRGPAEIRPSRSRSSRSGANKGVFLLAPLVTCLLALSAWAVIPVAEGWAIADINVGILYIFAISSLGVYGVIMAGWASNSKYPFLGALRSAAQMVSYEVSIGFVIITVLLCVGSLNLSATSSRRRTPGLGLFGWYWLPLFPMFVIFFISALAETNRPPFDLPGGGIGTGGGLYGRILLDPVSAVHARRIRGDHDHVRADDHPVPGWLAAAGRRSRPSPGCRACSGSCCKMCAGLLHVRHGEGLRAALPLRPADAAGLEGVPAAVAGHRSWSSPSCCSSPAGGRCR